MNYVFRNFELNDFDFLFSLKKENFKWYVDEIWGWNDNDQIERLKKDIAQNQHYNRKIIEIYNQPIGIYISFNTENGDFFIAEISLLKKYQNKGIGTSILKKQIEENKIRGIRTILQVFKNNPAKELYERLGFKIYNETETHYQMELI